MYNAWLRSAGFQLCGSPVLWVTALSSELVPILSAFMSPASFAFLSSVGPDFLPAVSRCRDGDVGLPNLLLLLFLSVLLAFEFWPGVAPVGQVWFVVLVLSSRSESWCPMRGPVRGHVPALPTVAVFLSVAAFSVKALLTWSFFASPLLVSWCGRFCLVVPAPPVPLLFPSHSTGKI